MSRRKLSTPGKPFVVAWIFSPAKQGARDWPTMREAFATLDQAEAKAAELRKNAAAIEGASIVISIKQEG